jgi:very-short-patch-repair endonuclease
MSVVHFTDILNRANGVHSDLVHLDQAAHFLGHRYGDDCGKVYAEIEALWHMLESPIEAALFPYLVMQDYGPNLAPARPAAKMRVPDAGEILVIPQVSFDPYRLDFAVTATKQIGPDHTQTATVAVECDGRGFHDTLKDTKRDLFMYGRGIITVRASGLDIYREPADVARRVAVLFQEWTQ